MWGSEVVVKIFGSAWEWLTIRGWSRAKVGRGKQKIRGRRWKSR